jgi:hypothetical protein
MELEVPRVWLRIKVDLLPDGRLALEVADDSGRGVRAPRTAGAAHGWDEVVVADTPSTFGPVRVRRPVALGEMAAAALRRLPVHRTGTPHPTAVPVFVSAPADLRPCLRKALSNRSWR